MKAYAVLILLLPALVIADTARIATWNPGGFHQIPQANLDNFKTLNADGLLCYVSSKDLSGQGSPICTHGIGNLLDGYAFTNVDDPEYQDGTLRIVQMHDELRLSLPDYKAQVTDHLLLVAKFEAGVDND